MSDVLIRPAQTDDADAVFDLLTQFAVSYRPTRPAFDKTFPGLLPNPDADLLVATREGTVVGYALAFRLAVLFAGAPILEIQELMVAAPHRSQGIGGRLIEALAQRARAAGCIEITVPSRRAGAYYLRHGFDETAGYYKRKLGAG